VRIFKLLLDFQDLLRLVIEQTSVWIHLLAVLSLNRQRRPRRPFFLRRRLDVKTIIRPQIIDVVAVPASRLLPRRRRRSRPRVEPLHDPIPPALQLGAVVRSRHRYRRLYKRPHVHAAALEHSPEIVHIHRLRKKQNSQTFKNAFVFTVFSGWFPKWTFTYSIIIIIIIRSETRRRGRTA
jgi:hypothetical protein